MRVQTCAQNLCGTFNWFCLVSILRGDQSKSNIAFGDSYLYYLRPLQHKYFQRDWIALSDMYRFQVIVCLFLFLNQQCSNSSCNISVVIKCTCTYSGPTCLVFKCWTLKSEIHLIFPRNVHWQESSEP